jgi:hypothetical protein
VADDLLGVELQRLDALLHGCGGPTDGGHGVEGLDLYGTRCGLSVGCRHGAVALAEYGVTSEGVQQALHHHLSRVVRRWPDVERECYEIVPSGGRGQARR